MGLSFIQSYAVDKKLTMADLRYERIDVVTGAVLTGVIGFFVVVAYVATLHVQGVTIDSAADAAGALESLVGDLASTLFGAGLIGAALLAAAILPLSTAYSVYELTGSEAGVDDEFAHARQFHVTYIVVTGVAALIVLVPGAPLIPILVLSQVLNAVLLPLLAFMHESSATVTKWAPHRHRTVAALYLATIARIAVCVAALFVLAPLIGGNRYHRARATAVAMTTRTRRRRTDQIWVAVDNTDGRSQTAVCKPLIQPQHTSRTPPKRSAWGRPTAQIIGLARVRSAPCENLGLGVHRQRHLLTQTHGAEPRREALLA